MNTFRDLIIPPNSNTVVLDCGIYRLWSTFDILDPPPTFTAEDNKALPAGEDFGRGDLSRSADETVLKEGITTPPRDLCASLCLPCEPSIHRSSARICSIVK